MAERADRPYFKYSIEQVESLFGQALSDCRILSALEHELSLRSTNRAARLRKKVAMSQRCACRESGVNRATLRAIELGQDWLSIDHVECLLAAYGFELEVFKAYEA